ncbi:MAG: hypothetical protein M1817_006216 [Caeruleum heppii]|nr:MAG: hypothetical protein M1817_006216 [Caeruleum heppii]
MTFRLPRTFASLRLITSPSPSSFPIVRKRFYAGNPIENVFKYAQSASPANKMASLITGNKFDPSKDVPDLSGKTYVVTGGSAGIGFGIVAHLLEHSPAKVYLLSNKEEHADDAVTALKNWGDVSKIEWVKYNLSDLKQTDEAAKKLKEELTSLDALVCNAGLGVGPYSETKDGLDSHFQVNHLAQMHLTMILLPILQKTPNSRLVVQSSDLHRMAPSETHFADVAEINQDLGAAKLYNRTKLAQVLFIRALVRRMQNKDLGFTSTEQVFANATHPGAVSTDQQEQAVEAYGTLGKIAVAGTRPLMKDPIEQGCRPALFATTSEDVIKEKIQGEYIVPDRKVTTASNQALDEALGEQLWKLSERILVDKLVHLPYRTHLSSGTPGNI